MSDYIFSGHQKEKEIFLLKELLCQIGEAPDGPVCEMVFSSSSTSIQKGSGPLSTIQFLLYPFYGGTKDSVTLKGKKKMSETC